MNIKEVRRIFDEVNLYYNSNVEYICFLIKNKSDIIRTLTYFNINENETITKSFNNYIDVLTTYINRYGHTYITFDCDGRLYYTSAGNTVHGLFGSSRNHCLINEKIFLRNKTYRLYI